MLLVIGYCPRLTRSSANVWTFYLLSTKSHLVCVSNLFNSYSIVCTSYCEVALIEEDGVYLPQ